MRRIVAFGITAVALLMQPARAATGVITGYALDSGGRGLAGVCVVADDDAAGTSFSNYTDGDGVYAVSVAPGSYVVAFHDCSGAGYADQWWNNTPSIDLATPVTIADGQTANGIDAQLVLGGTLSGTVYDAGTAGLEGMCVDLESATDHVVTTTRESGLWGVSVPTGDYLVKFSDCDRNEHPWQWYDGKRVPDDADPIEVVPSGSVSNVNAHLTDNPDPSVTAVRASVPLAPGDAATVSVDVANTSDVATDFTLLVEACPKTIGECWPLAADDDHLEPAGAGTRTYSWNTGNWIGDAVITARIETPFDSDRTNNVATANACVRTPVCAGVGVHL